MPLRFDEERQQYILQGGSYLPPTNFSTDEALSLIVLCRELGDGSGLPFLNSARSAAVKLESALPGRLRDQLRELTAALTIQPLPRNPLEGKRSVFEQFREALAGRRSWYVAGRSSLHRATRTFNLSRVTEIEPLEERYRIPRGFTVERFLRNARHLIPEPGPDWNVVVRYSKMVASNVAEVQWHKTRQIEWKDDGRLDFRVTVSGLNEISWWILGYGDQAEVLRPEELRRIIARRAARMAEMYG